MKIPYTELVRAFNQYSYDMSKIIHTVPPTSAGELETYRAWVNARTKHLTRTLENKLKMFGITNIDWSK